MARGKKTGGKNFEPGNNANPNGRGATPPDLRRARELTKIEFERVANKYLFATKQQISETVQDPETPMLDMLVCTVMMKGVTEGDERRLSFLLDRLIGRLPQAPEASLGEDEERGPLIQLIIPSNGRDVKSREKDAPIRAESRPVK